MDTMDAILSRRSIRKYTKEPVPKEVLNQLLEAAMSSPSAGNEKLWHFIAIDDRQILDEIPKYHPYADALRHAPLAVVVCGDLKLEILEGFWLQDCSAATENMLIAAQAKGLGAVWLAIYPRQERVIVIQELLGLPEHVVPLCIVAIGYQAEKKVSENRFDPSRIHWNVW